MIVLSDLVPVSPMGGRLVQGGGGQLESRRPRIGRRGALPIAERRHPTNLDSTLAVITRLQKSDKKHAGTQPVAATHPARLCPTMTINIQGFWIPSSTSETINGQGAF